MKKIPTFETFINESYLKESTFTTKLKKGKIIEKDARHFTAIFDNGFKIEIDVVNTSKQFTKGYFIFSFSTEKSRITTKIKSRNSWFKSIDLYLEGENLEAVFYCILEAIIEEFNNDIDITQPAQKAIDSNFSDLKSVIEKF